MGIHGIPCFCAKCPEFLFEGMYQDGESVWDSGSIGGVKVIRIGEFSIYYVSE